MAQTDTTTKSAQNKTTGPNSATTTTGKTDPAATPNTGAADSKPTETNATGDRGDVGTVTIRKSTREITSVRTRTSTDPIHVAVKDAAKGEWYDIEVDDDATKIERVARKLRAAAQKFDVGMNIHPDHIKAETPGKVIVSFRTGDRDKRAKTDGAATDGNTGDTAKG